jgi:hypothetical protein
MGAGAMFYFSDFWHNLAGIILLMFANFCDSTDGQLARLTGQKTMIGRMLDGFAGDVWFFCIYLAILLRLWHQPIPFTDDIEWGIGAFVLCAVASLLCHSPQSSLADYYRQIHLFFLSGKDGSEFSTWKQNKDYYDSLPKEARLDRAFYYNYCNYCKSQERRTPAFQRFMSLWTTEAIDNEQREQIRQEFGDPVATLVYSETSHLPHDAPWRDRRQAQADAIASASRDSKIVALGDKLSNLRAIVTDYHQIGDALWQRFKAPNGKEDILWYYTILASALRDLAGTPPYEEYLKLLKEL